MLSNLKKESFDDGDYLVNEAGEKLKKFIAYNLDGDEVWEDLESGLFQNQWGHTLKYDLELDNYYV